MRNDKKPRVCILSMQRINNYGSVLQGYSLKCMLEEIGCQVFFIDIVKNDSDNALRGELKYIFEEERERTFLSKAQKIDRYLINRLTAKLTNRNQRQIFEEFRREKLGIQEKQNEEKYDLCIVGSDEVFNCMSNSEWGFTSQLFGNVPQAERVITYAASCGATDSSQLTSGMVEKIKESFCRIDGFSVRDLNTKNFVASLSSAKVLFHMDPVVVADFCTEISASEMPKGLKKPYCVIYSYPNRIKDPAEIEAIRKFCNNHNLNIVSLCSQQFWIRNFVACKPFQLLKVFSNAEFVITDTFHGCIFSSKYAKRFSVIVRDSNRNKLLDLVDRLGVEKHLVTSVNQLEEIYLLENDIHRIEKIGLQERERSIKYLKEHVFRDKY